MRSIAVINDLRYSTRKNTTNCCYNQSLTDIAKTFSVSISGLTQARDCVREDLAQNKKVEKKMKKIEVTIIRR